MSWPATQSNTVSTSSPTHPEVPGCCDDDAMTEPQHRAVISRLSADFATISEQLARVSADLTELDRLLPEQPPAPQPVAAPQPYVPPAVPYWPQYQPPYPAQYSPASGWAPSLRGEYPQPPPPYVPPPVSYTHLTLPTTERV